MSTGEKLYPYVSPIDLEPQFSAHMLAMTVEALHGKGDIAKQLALRDRQIAAVTAERDKLRAELDEARALLTSAVGSLDVVEEGGRFEMGIREFLARTEPKGTP